MLDELKRLAQAATPGPRTIRGEPFENGTPYFYIDAGHGYWGTSAEPSGFQLTGVISQADADLAALAPETLTALIRRLQAAEASLLTARKVVEAARWIRDHSAFDDGLIDAAPDLSDALAAHDAAEVARKEGDAT